MRSSGSIRRPGGGPFTTLGSVEVNPSTREALQNLTMDARLYKWDRETVAAIREGIMQASRPRLDEDSWMEFLEEAGVHV